MAKGAEHGGVGVEDRGTTRQQRDGRARGTGGRERDLRKMGNRWEKQRRTRALYREESRRVGGKAATRRGDGRHSRTGDANLNAEGG